MNGTLLIHNQESWKHLHLHSADVGAAVFGCSLSGAVNDGNAPVVVVWAFKF